MNRARQILSLCQPEFDAPDAAQVDQARMQSALHDGVAHWLFCPMHYESNYAYPLVVWLHGAGDDEQQLRRIMPLVSMRNYVAVAPRGTAALSDEPTAARRFGWPQTDEDILLAEQRVHQCVHLARQKFHIAADRVFLAGFDAGGTMAYRVALAQPDRFAGVAALCSAFPSDRTPLATLHSARRLPLLVVHGRQSGRFPTDALCSDLRLFHTAGMSITVRQYPCGHQITPRMLSDMDAWLMAQITGVSTLDDSSSLVIDQNN